MSDLQKGAAVRIGSYQLGIILCSTLSSCLLNGDFQNICQRQINQHHKYPYFLAPGTQNTANPFRAILDSDSNVQLTEVSLQNGNVLRYAGIFFNLQCCFNADSE